MELKPFIVVNDQVYIHEAFLKRAGIDVTFDEGKAVKTVINISDEEGRIRVRIIKE